MTDAEKNRAIAESMGLGKPACDRIGGCMHTLNLVHPESVTCKCDKWEPRDMTEPEMTVRLIKTMARHTQRQFRIEAKDVSSNNVFVTFGEVKIYGQLEEAVRDAYIAAFGLDKEVR